MKCIAKFILLLMMAVWLPVSTFATVPLLACHHVALPHQVADSMAMGDAMQGKSRSNSLGDHQSPLTCHDGAMYASCAMTPGIPAGMHYQQPEMGPTYHSHAEILPVWFIPEPPYRPPLTF